MNLKKHNGVYAPYYYKAREAIEREKKNNEINSLFKKYKNPLSKLANNRFGRKLLHIDVDEKVDELFTGGFSWRTNKKGIYQAQFKTPFQYAKKIGTALTQWDIAKEYLQECEHKLYRRLGDYKGLLHYVGLDDFYGLPVVALLENTTKAVSGGSGVLRVGSATWSTCRDATTATSVDADGISSFWCQNLSSNYNLSRIMQPFDTSAIQGASASAAVFYIYSGQNTKYVDVPFYMVLTPSTQTDMETLDADDYNNITKNSPLECAPRFNIGTSWTAAVGSEHSLTYDDSDCLALIANGTGGFTQLCIRDDGDVDNDSYGIEQDRAIYPASGANATDGYRPKLVVTYTLPQATTNYLKQYRRTRFPGLIHGVDA